ncbi:WSCD family member GA21586-like [Homarus americanus]|uniref:WSC domain-containing protein 2-like 1 n=1 Tax=Homarus americanus TaxID=6706 RepID=A0A8J5N2J2_HOMAM|nr:WSCD family member GA21586-like [Homarus americanus]KAG7171980.1 WSC domain-containing protein 2-like 1 [Homarus americanus]
MVLTKRILVVVILVAFLYIYVLDIVSSGWNLWLSHLFISEPLIRPRVFDEDFSPKQFSKSMESQKPGEPKVQHGTEAEDHNSDEAQNQHFESGELSQSQEKLAALTQARLSKTKYRTLKLNYGEAAQAVQLWPDDPKCSKMRVRFAKDFEGTLLHSYPRSGNSWTRYLLEAATGVFTSSVPEFKEISLIKAGYLGERYSLRDRNTIVTKVHTVAQLQRYPTLPSIFIIRNPARVIVSFWAFKNIQNRTKKHVAVLPSSAYNTTEFRSYVQQQIKNWLKINCYVLQQNRTRLLPVYYEKLRNDPMKEVRRMVEFLRLRPDEERLACLARHLSGKMKGGQKKYNPYGPHELKKIEEAVEVIRQLLVKRGFPPLPDYSRYEN